MKDDPPRGRPRFLCLAHDFPSPLDNGSSVRVAGLLRLLARIGDVRLVVRPRSTTTEEDLLAVRSLGVDLVLGPSAAMAPWRGAQLWWRSLATRTPPWYVLWTDERLARLVERHGGWCTHVVAMEDFAAAYLLKIDIPRHASVVVDKHKVYAVPQSIAQGEDATGSLRRRVLRRVVVSHERRTLAVTDTVIVNTDVEADNLRRLHGRGPDAVIPTPMELPARWRPRDGSSSVLWMGTIDSRWNREGLVRLLESIRRLPAAGRPELVIAGRGADPALHDAAAGLPVRFTGYVEDLGSLLRDVAAAVLPLWAGGGERIKALLLLGSGVPVVATPMAVAGTGAVPGVHCLIGETPDELLAHLAAVRRDVTEAAAMGERARQLIRDRHDESRLLDALAATLGVPELSPGSDGAPPSVD